MYKLKIKITKKILNRSKFCGIKLSKRNYPFIHENCAIAVGVREIFPKANVGSKFIELNLKDKIFEILLPITARKFIHTFDKIVDNSNINCILNYGSGKDFNYQLMNIINKRLDLPEIEFEIELPDDLIEQIDIQDITKRLEEINHLELIEV